MMKPPFLNGKSSEVRLRVPSGKIRNELPARIESAARSIDTIDASNVDDSMLAHSYFVESIPVIRDIARMLRSGAATTERGALKMVKARDGVHWVLQK